ELACAGLVLRDLPRLVLLDVAVESPDQFPDQVERAGEIPGIEARRQRPAELVDRDRELGRNLGRHQAAPAGASDQSRRPGEEIAELVAELALVARVDVLHRGVAVLPEGRGADEVEAKGVG